MAVPTPPETRCRDGSVDQGKTCYTKTIRIPTFYSHSVGYAMRLLRRAL